MNIHRISFAVFVAASGIAGWGSDGATRAAVLLVAAVAGWLWITDRAVPPVDHDDTRARRCHPTAWPLESDGFEP